MIDVFFSKTFFLGTMTWRQRIRVYIQDVWNKCDLIAITLFIIGLICRWKQKIKRGRICSTYSKLITPKLSTILLFSDIFFSMLKSYKMKMYFYFCLLSLLLPTRFESRRLKTEQFVAYVTCLNQVEFSLWQFESITKMIRQFSAGQKSHWNNIIKIYYCTESFNCPINNFIKVCTRPSLPSSVRSKILVEKLFKL